MFKNPNLHEAREINQHETIGPPTVEQMPGEKPGLREFILADKTGETLQKALKDNMTDRVEKNTTVVENSKKDFGDFLNKIQTPGKNNNGPAFNEDFNRLAHEAFGDFSLSKKPENTFEKTAKTNEMAAAKVETKTSPDLNKSTVENPELINS